MTDDVVSFEDKVNNFIIDPDNLSHFYTREAYAWKTADWMVRAWAPMWLERGRWDHEAKLLAALPEIDGEHTETWLPLLRHISASVTNAWQQYIAPLFNRYPKNWDVVGDPIWAACMHTIRASGWWQLPVANKASADLHLLPQELTSIAMDGTLFPIAQNITRWYGWHACEDLVCKYQDAEVWLNPIEGKTEFVDANIYQQFFAVASMSLQQLNVRELQRKLI